MPSQFPSCDALFANWGENFALVCNANAATLGLDAGDLAEIDGAAAEFAAAYEESEAAKLRLRGAIATKDEKRDASLQVYQRFARQFAANPDIPATLRGELGLKVGQGSLGPVQPPSELSATGFSNGENRLVWNRNGNAQGTVFVIEARLAGSSNWEFVDVTTKTRYVDGPRTPGVEVRYRVYAKRGGAQSSISNIAVVYPGLPAASLRAAA